MPKGVSTLERTRETISRLCDFGQRNEVIEFCASYVGGGPYSAGAAQVAGVLSTLVVLGYVEEIGRGRNGNIFYRTTRQSLEKLRAQVKQAEQGLSKEAS
jgi:DNA-binding PadR family transcriptional regulator